ncbi:hypothetical protein IC582_005752 [Cucumis melo]|uniref:UDP-Glycosyltransferase superfamily protein isoform 3 n=1 Tax=Cucumis melo var. makuwa TaxID=1194695 RepID=A0A5A7UUA8_CUCMM|nr:UDP-Glycosyltransferase superfamily protein isoform 3 [Cucumis melo var. makuwa]TYJ97110.1 UDP-Glycosyltransferase superfamily protein isoform 3 [Cucumis melo var. makuwa]
MRRSSSSEIDDNASANAVPGTHSIRDRFPFKRNSSHFRLRVKDSLDHAASRSRSHQTRINRKGLLSWIPARGQTLFYFLVVFAVFGFFTGSMLLQSSISLLSSHGSQRERWLMERIKFGSSLKFVPGRISRRLVEGDGLEEVRKKDRVGVRAPRLALILGSMENDPQSLMLITVMKNMQKLGYVFEIFAVESGNKQSMWEQIGQPSILSPGHYGRVDWSIYDGIIADSLETEGAIASLMQEPFCSLPLIWIVREDTLASRLPMYEQRGWKHLISHWKRSFRRANVVVFPDFALPMLYSILDNGNFHVIPGSPADVYAAENYMNVHSKSQLREKNGFNGDDILVLVVGSLFFPNELSWDYAVAMHSIGPLLSIYARRREVEGSFKFVFLCCNSTDGSHDALKEIASRLGLPDGSITHYGLNGDVNNVLMMADIVLYGSSQEIQSFPPLLIRAMSFGIPIMVPDLPALRNYIVDGVHGVIFPKHNPDALLSSFSQMISDGKLSRFAQAIASSGRLLAKNILASECVTGYVQLLENVLNFPSDVKLPGPASQLQLGAWEWNLFRKEMVKTIDENADDEERIAAISKASVIFALEAQLTNSVNLTILSENENGTLEQDIPTPQDWDILEEIESAEEYETVEMEEFQERMERDLGAWDEIYRNARKSEKLKFEANERDEGELERTGQTVSIYEIYSGAGAWPFMHHGSLYRGLSLSTRALRLKSDDVNAVGRLPLLNDSYYLDALCEIGGMFAIANKIDNIHKRPWIGFQSWRASGRKVSLGKKAENVLEDTIRDNPQGDVIYFWAHLQVNRGTLPPTFWSVCDILNGGLCRTTFGSTFREMFGLSSNMGALPPMPEDGGHWSALHSWVMPTPSFLEFIMFSRMFTHYLDALNRNQSQPNGCLFAFSEIEKKHCYCRILEMLVNVWAYHSGRRMVYINPQSGFLEEQHPVEQRKEFMWAKYFNFTLLKSMDEDLAEAADDEGGSGKIGLWPLTGEVHWQGIYEREREERYRVKMDKKRTTKVKLMERMKFGYKQKSLGG